MVEQVAVTVLEIIVEKLVDPIIRQFSYLFFYKSNIKSFTDGVDDLKNKKSGATLLVDAAERNLETIGPHVDDWLQDVQDIEIKAEEVLQGTNKVTNGFMNGWCPNLKQRYMLSRKVVKQTVKVKELQKEGENYTKLSYPALPAGMVASTSIVGSEVFESQVSKTKEILDALKDESVSKIGICGLGGIGKTKMAKEVRDRVKVANLFDEVAMAVVSQNQDLKKIQDELASMLGLKLEANNNIEDRGSRLCERLANDNKRVLVILDDLWEGLDLDEIGIPVEGQGWCKVLIITRDEHVCIAMDAQKIFAIQVLSREEAWDLFKQKAGDCVLNVDIHPIAREVSSECGGLPLAIVTVATALKQRGKDAWEDALEQLKKSSVTCIPGMDAKVYSSLRLSYDYLKRKPSSAKKEECSQLQRLFLLCCLFPEDSDISVELLFRFFMGLRFFGDGQHLESAKRRVRLLTDLLRSCYLLLPSDKEGYVKVHDVVRDFGLQEASSGANVYFSRHDGRSDEWPLNDEVEPYTAISIGSQNELQLPLGLDYPFLQLLQLLGGGYIKISRDYFSAMKDLRVVFLESKSVGFHYENMSIESPPKALEFFMNVQTLCLENCVFSTDIGLIGSMHKLKVLSFYECTIDVLPTEIGQLSNLKLLDLRSMVHSIIPGVLSRLTKLEDLYMGEYFHVEKTEERDQEKHASITELTSLSGLTTLQVGVAEEEDLLKLKDFPFHMLKRFHITGNCYSGSEDKSVLLIRELGLRRFNINFFQESTELTGLLKRAEVLNLTKVSGLKNTMKEAYGDDFKNLKALKIEENEDMVEICMGNLPAGAMGMLEELNLFNLSVLSHLWRGPVQPPSLVNLKVIYIRSCEEIVTLFSRSAARCLVQLEKLTLSDCEKLKEIVSSDGAEDENHTKNIEFPKLKYVIIEYLPSFKGFIAADSKNNHNGSIFNEVLLPSMERLDLERVDVVKLVCGKMHPTFFYKLRDLNLSYCGMLSCVVAFEEIKLLQNLQTIRVGGCNSVEALFDLKGVDVLNENGSKVIVLDQLYKIHIYRLDELTHLCKNVPKQGFQGFQKLKVLFLENCNKIKYVLSVSMAGLLVNLEEINLQRCKRMEEIIKMDDDEEKEGIIKKMDKIVFPQLRRLHLRYVSLKVFCQGNHDLEFPVLEEVLFIGCSNMNNFCSGSPSTPQLMSVITGSENQSVWKGDLNKTLRHIYQRNMARMLPVLSLWDTNI